MVDTAGDTETDSVLKGVVRAERLETPEDYIDAIQEIVKREHIAAQYKLPKDGDKTWKTSIELMEMISRRSGRLLKGGDPCLRSAAITLINDFQRGRLPHYVSPPELKEEKARASGTLANDETIVVDQNLDEMGEENMEKSGEDDNDEDLSDGDKKMKAARKMVNAEADDSSDEDDEEAALSTNLIGSGDWEE